MAKQAAKTISTNRAAFHDYYMEETYEAGLCLSGTEVKSVRAGRVNLKDSFAYIRDGEVFVSGMHISPYEKGNIMNKDPMRHRKLLLNKREIRKLRELSQRDGYSLIPTDLHFSGAYVKMNLAVAKGKKLYDKRDVAAQKDAKRDIERAARRYK